MTMNMLGIEVEDLPELETEISLFESERQEEVGGGICLALAAGIAIGLSWN
jgi:hypothetical protein